MTNFLNKIRVWFRPRSIKRTSLPKPTLIKETKPKKSYSFNSQRYNKLISQLTAKTLANERHRKRKFEDQCSHCQKWITRSAIIGIGRCCLVKNYKDCPNHGEGELV